MLPRSGPATGALRGAEMNDLGVIERANVFVDWQHGKIFRIDDADAPVPRNSDVIEAGGRVLMPGFVDCHTHACWAGSRIDEWQEKLAGKTYQEIMASGGGIMSTVRAVRAAGFDLVANTISRLQIMTTHGSTTVEIKSGYGLQEASELEMLSAIEGASLMCKATVVPTALLGHAIDPDHPGGREAFIHHTSAHTLASTLARCAKASPGGHATGPTIDAFCEEGAWTVEECVSLFEAARTFNPHTRIRVHADQFNSLGMVREAIRLGAVSVDHLEASTESDLSALAQSETFGVILPCCGFHLDGRYANGRYLIDHGGKLCIATNYNPGSAPCPSVPMAIALAVRHCGLTPNEAIVAATRNPAVLLGFSDRGFIAPGARADLLLLNHSDERALAYEFGGHHIDWVFVAGRRSVWGGITLPPSRPADRKID